MSSRFVAFHIWTYWSKKGIILWLLSLGVKEGAALSWSLLTYIFPLAAIAALILLARDVLPALERRPGGGAGGERLPRPAFTFRAERGAMTGRDAALMLGITAVYALAAFTGLGDTSAPESFCRFEGEGSYVEIALPEDSRIAGVKYYCGLNTGSYYLQYSDDGTDYTDVTVLEQGYADLFKWICLDVDDFQAGYIRIIADGELWLGELALCDGDGTPIDPGSLVYDAGCAPLFDERELVPEAQTYLNSTYFDEIYHARTAYEHLEGVYPYEITHPPLGKLIIAAGIRLFGMDPFGWRFSGTLFGVLMLPVLYIFLSGLFGSTAVSCCGTAVFAFDFMHFVQTRIATIDTYAVFFILLMYLFMWRWVSGGRLYNLALSGVFFGMGAASKWVCIYAGAGLAAIWLLYWISRRRETGFWRSFIENSLLCVIFFVLIPCAIYYVSYFPYGQASGMSGLSMFFTGDYARMVLHNQEYMWNYHSGLVATHPYSSRWYEWLLDARPILYYLESFPDGTKSSFGAFLSPVLCWGGLMSMLGCLWLAVTRRDGRSWFILIGYLAQLLPWVLVSRLTFAYHYFPSCVFLALAIGRMYSAAREEGLRCARRDMLILTAMALVLFAAFYPNLTGVRVSSAYSSYFLKWLPGWPF